MFKRISLALLGGACSLVAGIDRAAAFEDAVPSEPTVLYAPQASPAPVRVAYNDRANMGGGFIEFLFGGEQQGQAYYPQQQPMYQQQPAYYDQRQLPAMGEPQMQGTPEAAADPRARPFDPKFEKQLVDYSGREGAGTIIVDTPNKFLYLVEGNGKALRYGIGVGRYGFTWQGVQTVSRKAEWPDWHPPKEMQLRDPTVPDFMKGGPGNPLGARAMYLGNTEYRIHGTAQPWTIGTSVSSGCIRLTNDDVTDLYNRVKIGAKVIVQ